MIFESEDELGYYAGDALHDCPYCGAWIGHRYGCPARQVSRFAEGVYEECPDCGGEGMWRHHPFGPQPCLRCMETGLVPHNCDLGGD